MIARRASVIVLTALALAIHWLWLTRYRKPREVERVLMSTVGRSPYTPEGDW